MDGAGLSNAPVSAQERRKSALLWLLVLVQLAIPSSYYLVRADHEDERFAWRMFSALRFRNCNVQAFEQIAGQERSIALSSTLHASWIGALRRGRGRVIGHFLESRCAQNGVESATIERRCREVDLRPVPAQRFLYSCQSRHLTRELAGEPL
jgi:hypothetical protein